MAARKHRRRRRSGLRSGGRDSGAAADVRSPAAPTILRLMACDGGTCHESTVLAPAELTVAREKWPVVWLDVDGFEDLATIRSVGQIFEIGDLALEDAVTPDERPKVEVFGHQVLIAVRMARFDGDQIVTDPMAIFLGDRYVITFHDRSVPDGFAGVRERIRHGRTRLGQGHLGADHLCALLLDAVIDGYFPVLERFGDRLEEIEDAAIENPSRDLLGRIHDVRNDLMTLRRCSGRPATCSTPSAGSRPRSSATTPASTSATPTTTPWRSSTSRRTTVRSAATSATSTWRASTTG